ncbi:MAG: polysaccharide biosynthesis tyrosine autokinase [Bacteriodetes bacterium]|nr:polysaccharide biosynthesis tyrosine autokinase [Bacteroidota bacterium]
METLNSSRKSSGNLPTPQSLKNLALTPVQEKSTELYDYISIIMRGKWLIICSFLVVTGLTIAYTWTRPWVYESHAKMLISSEKGQNASAFFMGMMGQEERNIKNEIEVMRSKPLLSSTAKALLNRRYIDQEKRDVVLPILTFENVKENLRPKTTIDTIDAISGRLFESLQLSSIRDADVVEVRIRTNNAEEAAIIVNTFVHTYQNDNEDNNRSNARRVKEFLSGQVDRTRDTLGHAEADLQSYMSANGAIQMDEQSKNVIQKMSDFDSKYNEAKIMSATVNKTLEEYKKQLKDVEPEFSDNLAASANPYIESLQGEIARLEVRRDLIITKNEAYASKVAYDAAMSQLEQQIQDLKNKLRSKTEELRKSKLGSVPVYANGSNTGTVNPTMALNALKQKIFDLEIQKQSEESKVKALGSARNEAEGDFRRIPSQVIDLARLERTSSSLGKLHDLLSEKLNEAAIAEQSVFGNVRVFEPASASFVPVSPNRLLNVAIGCIFGFALGIGLVVARSFIDSTVRTPEELENRGFVVLATIPKIPRDLSLADIKPMLNETNKEFFKDVPEESMISSHLISHVNPKSPIAENYRSVRTAIQFAHVDTHVQTVMVASSVPQEGKSTTSVNIATTLAQAGNKTLWIDCDLRRPVGHNVFHTSKEPGIVNVLVGNKTIEQAARPSGIPNLDIMTSGPIPPNPSELLGSQRMRDLLEELKKRYDNIIIDTPPVVAVTDAVILSTLVDAYILVARANTTHMEIVSKSRESIDRVGGRMLGIVLNDFDVSNNYGSYYKYYRYYKYYNYYGEDAPMQGVKKPRVVSKSKSKKVSA